MLSSFVQPTSVISLLHACFHLGLATLFFPLVCPHLAFFSLCALLYPHHHFSRFSVIFLDACAIHVIPLMCLFWMLSLHTSISASWYHLLLLVVRLVILLLPKSAPFNRACLTTVLFHFECLNCKCMLCDHQSATDAAVNLPVVEVPVSRF